MRPFDLTSGAARLNNALRVLQSARMEVMSHWTDKNSQSFDETYLEPLEARVKRVLEVADHLSEVLATAQHECEPR